MPDSEAATREAAARREALLGYVCRPLGGCVADANRRNIERAESAEAKVARVEALAERQEDAGHEMLEGYDIADLIRDSLAEPERDEESS